MARPSLTTNAPPPLRHRQIDVEGIAIHAVEAGTAASRSVLLLHGWPEDWTAFERVMLPVSDEANVVAIDLPGIGGSATPPPANDKRTLARYVRGVIDALGLRDVRGRKVSNSGHFAPNEQPEELVTLIREFVALEH
jgi:pimeloyl-ACP methyl ester carboxylesterase